MSRPTIQRKHRRNCALLRDFLLGLSGKEIAAKYGITRTRVYQLTRGIKRKNNPYKPTSR